MESSRVLCLKADPLESNGDGACRMVQLPHPSDGRACRFVLQAGDMELLEVTRVGDGQHASWFVDDEVVRDGSMHVMSRIDPLLILLQLAEFTRQKQVFATLDSILRSDQFPHAIYLEKALRACELGSILIEQPSFDGNPEYSAYKLDDDRVLSWLARKVNRLADNYAALSAFHFAGGADDGSASKKRLAVELLSPYLSSYWLNRLCKHCDIDLSAPPAPVLSAAGAGIAPVANVDIPENEKAKKPKVSLALRALSNVDTKNMRTISSFFSK